MKFWTGSIWQSQVDFELKIDYFAWSLFTYELHVTAHLSQRSRVFKFYTEKPTRSLKTWNHPKSILFYRKDFSSPNYELRPKVSQSGWIKRERERGQGQAMVGHVSECLALAEPPKTFLRQKRILKATWMRISVLIMPQLEAFQTQNGNFEDYNDHYL